MNQAHSQASTPRPQSQVHYTNNHQSLFTNENETHFVSHNGEGDTPNNTEDHLPEGTYQIANLNDQMANLFGLCLFDSGSLATLLNERAIPGLITPKVGGLGSSPQFKDRT